MGSHLSTAFLQAARASALTHLSSGLSREQAEALWVGHYGDICGELSKEQATILIEFLVQSTMDNGDHSEALIVALSEPQTVEALFFSFDLDGNSKVCKDDFLAKVAKGWEIPGQNGDVATVRRVASPQRLQRGGSTDWTLQKIPVQSVGCPLAFFRNSHRCGEPVSGPGEFSSLPEHIGLMQLPPAGSGFNGKLWEFLREGQRYLICKGKVITVANPASPLYGMKTIAGFYADIWDCLKTTPSFMPPSTTIGEDFGYFYQVYADDVMKLQDMEAYLEDTTGLLPAIPLSGEGTPRRRPVILLESPTAPSNLSPAIQRLFRHPRASFAFHVRAHFDTLDCGAKMVFDHNLNDEQLVIVMNLAGERGFEFVFDSTVNHATVWNFAERRRQVAADLRELPLGGLKEYPSALVPTPVERRIVYMIADEFGLRCERICDAPDQTRIIVTKPL